MAGYEDIMRQELLRALWEERALEGGVRPPATPPSPPVGVPGLPARRGFDRLAVPQPAQGHMLGTGERGVGGGSAFPLYRSEMTLPPEALMRRPPQGLAVPNWLEGAGPSPVRVNRPSTPTPRPSGGGGLMRGLGWAGAGLAAGGALATYLANRQQEQVSPAEVDPSLAQGMVAADVFKQGGATPAQGFSASPPLAQVQGAQKPLAQAAPTQEAPPPLSQSPGQENIPPPPGIFRGRGEAGEPFYSDNPFAQGMQGAEAWAGPERGGYAFAEGPDTSGAYIQQVEDTVAANDLRRLQESASTPDPYAQEVEQWMINQASKAQRAGQPKIAADIIAQGTKVLGAVKNPAGEKLSQALLLENVRQAGRERVKSSATVAPPRSATDRGFQIGLQAGEAEGLTGDALLERGVAAARRVAGGLAFEKSEQGVLGKGTPAALGASRAQKEVAKEVKVGEEIEKEFAENAKTRSIVQQLDAYSKPLMTAERAGGRFSGIQNLLTRGTQAGGLRLGEFTQDRPLVALYNSTKQAFLGQLARQISMERGVLTNQDIGRVETALPALGDLADVRDTKIQTLYDLLELNKEAAQARATNQGQLPPEAEARFLARKNAILMRLEVGGKAPPPTQPRGRITRIGG